MAIFSAVPPPPELGGVEPNTQSHHDAQPQQQQQQPQHEQSLHAGVDIEAWTVSALESLNLSPIARGTGVPLTIPLDDTEPWGKPSLIYDPRTRSSAIRGPHRPSLGRDSLARREALLKGKEGSRQRRRWENDRLLHVPNATPPEPEDYAPRPTHPVNHVPYQVAAAWDLRVRAEVETRSAAIARRKQVLSRTLGDEAVAGRVPRELCQRAKKIPAVRTWVRSLEEPVRKYLVEREIARVGPDLVTDDSDDSSDLMDSEDEEIVFVGRKQFAREGGISGPGIANGGNVGQWKKARREEKTTGAAQDEGMLFDGFDEEDGGAFRRWITHSISDYYGLQSRSVLAGDPKRKVVYVGVESSMKTGFAPPDREYILPRPLWELC